MASEAAVGDLTAPVGFESEGSGTPVIMVHGRISTPAIWTQTASALAADFQVIRCHLRGSGSSPAGQSVYRNDEAGLIALLDDLGLTCVHLVGHASGGAVAAAVALRVPDRVISLAVIDPIVRRSEISPALQEAWHLAMLAQWLEVGHGADVRRPESMGLLRGVLADQTLARLADPPPVPSPPEPGPEFQYPSTFGTDMAHLARLHCPVLVLVGERAPQEAQTIAETVFGRARRFQLCRVEGASANSPREAPLAVARLLQHFFRETGG